MLGVGHLMDDDATSLFKMAVQAQERAYAPYSNFHVGAAVKTADGQIFAGCNVENVAYPEGTCAEAGAIALMVASGGRQAIRSVLVVADGATPVTPCGGCRQKLAEFGDEHTSVLLATGEGVQAETTLGALLPGAFSASHMERRS